MEYLDVDQSIIRLTIDNLRQEITILKNENKEKNQLIKQKDSLLNEKETKIRSQEELITNYKKRVATLLKELHEKMNNEYKINEETLYYKSEFDRLSTLLNLETDLNN